MIDARIEIHGPPPTELQQQRDWYQDALRDALKVAAKTRLVIQKGSEASPEQQGISNSSATSPYSQGPSASGGQGAGYNLPLMAAPQDMASGFQMTATHEPQVSSMNSHHPELALASSNFLSNNQQQSGLMATFSRNLAGETSAPSGMITGEMTDLETWDFHQNMADETGQLFDPQDNFGFPDYEVPFEASGSDMLEQTQDQSYWPRQQGKR
jgi:hypothetical protein